MNGCEVIKEIVNDLDSSWTVPFDSPINCMVVNNRNVKCSGVGGKLSQTIVKDDRHELVALNLSTDPHLHVSCFFLVAPIFGMAEEEKEKLDTISSGVTHKTTTATRLEVTKSLFSAAPFHVRMKTVN
jgi:hypothetical protein